MNTAKSPLKGLSAAFDSGIEIATSRPALTVLVALVYAWMVVGYAAALIKWSYENVEASALWQIYDWGLDIFGLIGACVIVYHWFALRARK